MPKAQNGSTVSRGGAGALSRARAPLFALLLTLSLLMSNMVHAAEQMCAPLAMGHVADGHGAPDSPLKGDSGAQHQHGGCHGHHLASPLPRDAETLSFAALAPQSPATGTHPAQAPPDHPLRPPIA